MSYKVKEIFYTLQGEGAHAGRPAVFCRFAGCNLWSGREQDRARAKCWFCDTDFVGTDGDGGGAFGDAGGLAAAIAAHWPGGSGAAERYVVFTGGEPMLQLDELLVEAMHERGFRAAIETNGTIAVAGGIDWITVSPKPGSELVQRSGHELKLVFPQEVQPESVEGLDFEHFYLSPRATGDSRQDAVHTRAALEYCLAHPRWCLTMQHHKLWGIP